LTGFEPFGGRSVNPSAEVAQALDGVVVCGHRVVGTVLPCVFRTSFHALETQILRHNPRLIICLGQAEGRAGITPERVAINTQDAPAADNAGQRFSGKPVVPGGRVAYWSTLPIHAIVTALQEAGIPAGISSSAGTFVCNDVFYRLMRLLERRPTPRPPGGFVHLPLLPAQAEAGQPSLAMDAQIKAIRTAIEVCLEAVRTTA